MSRRCGTICSTQIPTIPSRTKSLPVSSFSHLEDYLHIWKAYAQSRSRSSSLRYSTRLTWGRAPLLISRAQLALQGLYCAFFAPWELNRFLSPSNKEFGPLCKPIFLTPRLRKSCAQSRSLLFTALDDNKSYIKHFEHSSSLCWTTQVLHKALGALLFTVLDNTSYMKHL